MRKLAFAIGLLLGAACGGGLDDGIGAGAQPLAVYNAGPDTCDGYGVNSFVTGSYDCRPSGTVPITESSCPAAQWLWTGAPGGHSSATGNEKGNAYCAQYPYTGAVEWGTYSGPHTAMVQEIGGLWVPSISGCNKNIRVCLGTPTSPAVTSVDGDSVPGCGPTGSGGCAVCQSATVRAGAVASATDTCCTEGNCLRNTLSVTMDSAGAVTSDFAGIDCTSGSCSAEYSDLAHVTLTRGDGHVDWTGWGGACTGLEDSCAVVMGTDQSVAATYELGGTVTGALAPFGVLAPLDRDASTIAALPIALVFVQLSGSGYTYSHDGVCAVFASFGRSFVCGRLRAGSGTVTVVHDATGANRVFAMSFGRPKR